MLNITDDYMIDEDLNIDDAEIDAESDAPENAAPMPGYISEHELARRLRCHVRSLARWRRLGTAPPWVRIGIKIFYREAALREWLESLENAPNQAIRVGPLRGKKGRGRRRFDQKGLFKVHPARIPPEKGN